MNKKTKGWLWIALIICVLTTMLNASMHRYTSVFFALISIIGLLTLLLQETKQGFYLLCIGYALSFGNGILANLNSDLNMMVVIGMSFIGSIIIPGISALLLKSQWANLK